MKAYLSNYRNHWISPYTIMEKIIFWREIDYDEPLVEKFNAILTPFCNGIKVVLDFVHPRINYVKLDRWDTWSMDGTLAIIILPMLKQLKETGHGSGMIDNEDVPVELRSKYKKRRSSEARQMDIHSIDMEDNGLVHQRWQYALDEMIWSFEQKVMDDSEHQFFDFSKSNDVPPWKEGYVSPEVDWAALEAHRLRKQNGFRLFGKYFESLWD